MAVDAAGENEEAARVDDVVAVRRSEVVRDGGDAAVADPDRTRYGIP